MKLDDVLGIHAEALLLKGERARLLASNLANADTPGYQATDIDFQETLRNELNGRPVLQATNAAHFPSSNGQAPEVLFRNPSQPSIDGNTVDTQIEQAAFAENALGYEVSLRFLDSRISGLMQAIKGE